MKLRRYDAEHADEIQDVPAPDVGMGGDSARTVPQREHTPETDPVVMVDGPGPTLCLQRMPGKTERRNRWHIDVVGGPREVEIERLCRLGARVHEIKSDWTTLLDPEGNPFCVLEPRKQG